MHLLSFDSCRIYTLAILVLLGHYKDVLAYPSFYTSYTVPAWFILSVVEVSVPKFVVLLPSILASQLATLQLKMVQSVTSAHKGLAPSRLIPIFIGKDAHAGHTQCI